MRLPFPSSAFTLQRSTAGPHHFKRLLFKNDNEIGNKYVIPIGRFSLQNHIDQSIDGKIPWSKSIWIVRRKNTSELCHIKEGDETVQKKTSETHQTNKKMTSTASYKVMFKDYYAIKYFPRYLNSEENLNSVCSISCMKKHYWLWKN